MDVTAHEAGGVVRFRPLDVPTDEVPGAIRLQACLGANTAQ